MVKHVSSKGAEGLEGYHRENPSGDHGRNASTGRLSSPFTVPLAKIIIIHQRFGHFGIEVVLDQDRDQTWS